MLLLHVRNAVIGGPENSFLLLIGAVSLLQLKVDIIREWLDSISYLLDQFILKSKGIIHAKELDQITIINSEVNRIMAML